MQDIHTAIHTDFETSCRQSRTTAWGIICSGTDQFKALFPIFTYVLIVTLTGPNLCSELIGMAT